MLKDLKDLFIDELHDILSSEEQIVKALPEMVRASESPELKEAFEAHLKETKGQVQRLEKIFKLLKIKKKKKFCKATKGLIEECKEVLKDFKTKSPIRDAALISKAQRIEHYEISAYGTMRTFAKEIDLDDVAALLKDTLDEEANADKKLTKIAKGGMFKSGINLQANTINENESKKLKKKISKPKKTKRVTPKRKSASAKHVK
jgi:ferritin-like metal-binding protein YciE